MKNMFIRGILSISAFLVFGGPTAVQYNQGALLSAQTHSTFDPQCNALPGAQKQSCLACINTVATTAASCVQNGGGSACGVNAQAQGQNCVTVNSGATAGGSGGSGGSTSGSTGGGGNSANEQSQASTAALTSNGEQIVGIDLTRTPGTIVSRLYDQTGDRPILSIQGSIHFQNQSYSSLRISQLGGSAQNALSQVNSCQQMALLALSNPFKYSFQLLLNANVNPESAIQGGALVFNGTFVQCFLARAQ